MKNTTVLIIKFITSVIAFGIGLDLFFDATMADILSFSLLVTVVSYIVGDRIVLLRLGNTNATLVDFLLTYMSVWIFGSVLLDNYLQIAWGSFISAVIISAVEIFVHRALANTVNEEGRQTNFSSRLAYGTEFAKENDIHDLNKKEE